MSGIVPTRWLPAIVLLATLPAAPQARLTYTSASAADNIAADPPDIPLADRSPDLTVEPQPKIQLPPEQLADLYMIRQIYAAAIREYQTLPQPSAAVWNKMGIAYQQMFALHEAERCYKQAIKLDPKNPKFLNNLATVQDGMKNFGAAEKNYRKALRLNPDSAIERKNLGTNLLMQHKYDQGTALYKQALAIDPHVFDQHFGPKVNDPAPAAERGTANYFKARSCARVGLNDCALAFLNKALDEGAVTVQKVKAESDFAGLINTPAMSRLLANQQ